MHYRFSMKYTVTAYTILGQVFKTKTFETKPTFSQLNRLANRWAMQYGAHMGLVVKEVK